jgi:general secretion pathway protein G
MNTKSPAPVCSLPGPSLAAGFTLIEIMVVIVILGLLATLVLPNVIGASDEARAQTARTNCTTYASAVRLYRAEKGVLPDSLEKLAEPDEKGRSYITDLQVDPWDHAYEIRRGNGPNDWEVISMGPDGSPGTEDDITSKPTPKEK